MADKKAFADLTDEQIDALSPDELAEYQTGEGTGEPPASGDGTSVAPVVDEGNGTGAGGDDGAGGEGGDGDEDAEAERARLEALAAELDNGEGSGDGEDGAGGKHVPHARFNEVNEENKDLRLLLRTLINQRTDGTAPQQQQTPEPEAPKRPEYDFKAGMREYNKLVMAGDEDAAASKLDEIEDKRAEVQAFDLEQARSSARKEAVGEVSQTVTADRVRTVEKSLYEAFPFLNNRNKAADPDAILTVNAKAKALIAQGKDPAEALLEAGQSIGKRFAKLLGAQAPAADDKAGKGGKPGVDTRTADAIQRNLNVRQPATQKGGVGNREQVSKLDISKMTDEQIDKLEREDPAAFAELRGDNRVS